MPIAKTGAGAHQTERSKTMSKIFREVEKNDQSWAQGAGPVGGGTASFNQLTCTGNEY